MRACYPQHAVALAEEGQMVHTDLDYDGNERSQEPSGPGQSRSVPAGSSLRAVAAAPIAESHSLPDSNYTIHIRYQSWLRKEEVETQLRSLPAIWGDMVGRAAVKTRSAPVYRTSGLEPPLDPTRSGGRP
jgi:hypothetical protein